MCACWSSFSRREKVTQEYMPQTRILTRAHTQRDCFFFFFLFVNKLHQSDVCFVAMATDVWSLPIISGTQWLTLCYTVSYAHTQVPHAASTGHRKETVSSFAWSPNISSLSSFIFVFRTHDTVSCHIWENKRKHSVHEYACLGLYYREDQRLSNYLHLNCMLSNLLALFHILLFLNVLRFVL